jgi:ABC-type phosphate/phosphonate transport system substrate-binding protein
MIAALPMYDLPEIAVATDAFWHGLRSHLVAHGATDVPRERARPDELYAHWLERDLLLSQTCGYPLTHNLRGRVRYLATPTYRAQGCGEGTYCSVVLVRGDDTAKKASDLAGRKVAFNGTDSQSGYNVLRHYLALEGVEPGSLGGAIESGAHRRSASMVKAGVVDFCAVDCVSWALLQQNAPRETEGLRVLAETASAPCLPFITSLETPVEILGCLRSALSVATTDPVLEECCEALLLDGASVLEEDVYDVILRQEREAAAKGWSQLS